MKLHKTLLLFLLFMTSFITMFSQEHYENHKIYKEDNLVTLGKSYKERLQIPAKVLLELTTNDLIKEYLNCPLTSLIFAYTDPQQGFKRVYNEFNGLRELLIRKDAATELIKYFQQMKVDDFRNEWDNIKLGEFTVKFMFMEIILCQSEIIHMLNNTEKNELLKNLLQKAESKIVYRKIHSSLGISYSAYSIAKTLLANYRSFQNEYNNNDEIKHFYNA